MKIFISTITDIDQVRDAKAKAAEMDKSVQQYTAEAQKRFEEAKRETGQQVNQAINKFDTTVERKAAEVQERVSEGAEKAKGGIGSWFGFGGK